MSEKSLEGRTIAVLVANGGVEQVELTEPMDAIRAAGGTPVLVAPEAGEVQAFDHLDRADVFTAERASADVDVSEFDAVVLPGGVANPDQLRTDDAAVALVRAAEERGLPIAVICHGPWTLIEADVARGRRITSWPSLQTDLRNAGAVWLDEQVVVCDHGAGPIISSRNPDDLPAFCEALVEQIGALTPAR
jgi:protease I